MRMGSSSAGAMPGLYLRSHSLHPLSLLSPPIHQSFPVFLPVFHRIKVHSCSMYANRGERLNPTFTCSKASALTKLSYIFCKMRQRYPPRINTDATKGAPSSPTRVDLPFLFSRDAMDVFQSVKAQLQITCLSASLQSAFLCPPISFFSLFSMLIPVLTMKYHMTLPEHGHTKYKRKNYSNPFN